MFVVLLSGVIASLGTQHVTLPLKVILIRIQGGNSSGFLDAASKIIAENGTHSLEAYLDDAIKILQIPLSIWCCV